MKKTNGYTLIEVVIALAIFAIVSLLSTSVVMNSFNTYRDLKQKTTRLNRIQLVITMMRYDITQILNRSIRGNEMHLFPPFIGETNYTEFTRAGVINPEQGIKASHLKRVAFLCAKNQLIRRSWYSLDSTSRSAYHDKILLSHLEKCSFAYISRNLERLYEWRPYAVQQNQHQAFLPSAIEFNFEIKKLGPASLLFIIPEGLYGS